MCRMLSLISKKINPNLLREFRKLSEFGKVKSNWQRGHKDGWGFGYYDGKAIRITTNEKEFNEKNKDEFSAMKSKEFSKIIDEFECEKINTDILLVHLRKASDKSKLGEKFCHPFLKDNFLFMHNGSIIGKRWNDKEKIDTQIFFEDILKFYKEENNIISAIKSTKKIIEKEGYYTSLTFILSDGEKVFSYRDFNENDKTNKDYYTLYYIFKKGEFFAVCSEEIEVNGNEWIEIRNNEILIVDKNLNNIILKKL